MDEKIDLKAPEFYINRELSWLEFNSRVLEEAQDKANPLAERLKFLAITSSNLDEFFMVRVAGLAALEEMITKDPSGMTPAEQLAAVSQKIHEQTHNQYNCFMRSVSRGLRAEGINLLDYGELTEDEKVTAERYFNITLYPILTPMAIDRSRPFPFLSNRSLNIILELKIQRQDESERYAVVQAPSVVPRLFMLQEGRFILIEEIIKAHAHKLFVGNKVLSAFCFRITRDSDLEIDEEEEDLLKEVKRSVKKRKWGEPIRLEIERSMKKTLSKFLGKILELDESDIYEISGPLDLTFLMSLYGKCPDRIKNPPVSPKYSASFADGDMFEVLKERDELVHHPYESFDAVLAFVRAAARDKKVLAIKQTLYRVSGGSPIVEALIEAAENGKHVTVLVELKARFDEENNIVWAGKLEQSGCHVVYGLSGYKTHCKMCLVVRGEEDGIHRYVHLGTGNYNDSTAKLYTDLGFFTSKEHYCADVSALFNVLTGYSDYNRFNKLVVAPMNLRNSMVSMIETEERNAEKGRQACITAKMNSLVDPDIIAALYKAAKAGVKINLIVRGICCLRPGLEGISENITVVSIVDRYLEHSRIFCFENGGEPVVYLSSADWMQRNFDRRVEIAFPIEDENLKSRIKRILETTLADTVKLRVLNSNGSYSRVDRRGREHAHSQLLLHQKP